jgi:hypothetical protein
MAFEMKNLWRMDLFIALGVALLVAQKFPAFADRSFFQRRNGRAAQSEMKLKWNTPITAKSLGKEPNPIIKNKTISQIVNNVVSSQPDGMLCRQCHFNNKLRYKDPNTGNIGPNTDSLGKKK